MKKLLVFIFLIMLIGCNKTEVIENDYIERALNFQYEEWDDDALAGIMFLGYGDYTDFNNYRYSADFTLIEMLYPHIETVSIVQTNDGDNMFLIISRYKDSDIKIYDDEDKLMYEEDNFDVVFLRANLSDLYPDVKVVIKHYDKEVSFRPSVSNMDSRLEPINKIMDLSLYTGFYDFNGGWSSDNLELIINDDEIILTIEGLEYTGNLYLDCPIDFYEDFDDSMHLVYFDLVGEHERFQLFSKFVFSLQDDDTLYLKHLTYDPLLEDDVDKIYILERASG